MAKGGVVRIANHYTARIIFPRTGGQGVVMAPLFLEAGRATEVDSDVWNRLKKNGVVKAWIRKGMIAEVKKEGDVPVMISSTSTLIVPEHLRTENEEIVGKSETAPKAKVRRKTKGELKVG